MPRCVTPGFLVSCLKVCGSISTGCQNRGSAALTPPQSQEQKPVRMEKVIGIGGIFFKARDPQALAAWYRQHLGVPGEGEHAEFPAHDSKTPDENARTVWALFPADTGYFGKSGTSFMVNYRVANLDRMLEQLRQAGIAIEKVEDYDYGRFAWITDPEDNRIELWQPIS
jgi:predicted enzyme related to lactoylglutathione lyase